MKFGIFHELSVGRPWRPDSEREVYHNALAQIELAANRARYERKVYVLPKHLDEKVAALHLEHLGARLTKLSKRQAQYLGIPPAGPFKPEHYRY